MASGQDDLVDFNIIESHKENIQSLPSGRSAKALAALYSPPLTSQPSPLSDAHSAERAAFDHEISQIDDADDPLDVYDRYIKWTLNTYPSAQSTPSSRLLPLLERATKAFLSNSHYKNDVRYLRIWLHYVGLFSDAPKETFIFMARNGVGEELALFYEEYAAWLESQQRWTQAEEVYGIGIQKEARPIERLVRKFGEFERRKAALPKDIAERPDSPALPVVRQVLGQKVDPFASASTDQSQSAEAKPKKKTAKMAIFADDGAEKESVMGSKDGQSWDDIGSIHRRKKENTAEPESWVGQTMKVGKTNTGVEKMKIFRSSPSPRNSQSAPRKVHPGQCYRDPKTNRETRVAVNLGVVYPESGNVHVEYCFEEVMARRRGWVGRNWTADQGQQHPTHQPKKKSNFDVFPDDGILGKQQQIEVLRPVPQDKENLVIRAVALKDENDENAMPRSDNTKPNDTAKRLRREERANRTRKIKMEVRHEKKETQTVQLNMSSPTRPKIRRNKKEQTMTINTREAMEEIYGIFSQPTQTVEQEEDDEDSDDEDDYTSGGESTTTGRISATNSEYGDDTRREIMQAYGMQNGLPAAQSDELENDQEENDSDDEAEATDGGERTNVTAWSDFTTSKHVTQDQADVSRKAKLQISQDDPLPQSPHVEADYDLITPVEELPSSPKTRYVPLPPEDYEPSSGTYRDRVLMANNRLPFMTPIAEATESSIGTSHTDKDRDYFTAKTPSRLNHGPVVPIPEDDDENMPWSSPFQEQAHDTINRVLGKVKPLALPTAEGPLIKDAQVNPVDPMVRDFILAHPRTRVEQHAGYHDHRDTDSGRLAEIRKYAKTYGKKAPAAGNNDKTSSTIALPPVLAFPGADATYTLRRELGAGAFAPVYLVESHQPDCPEHASPSLAAMKVETAPPSAWEFHMLSLAHSRLGSSSRAAASLVLPRSLHLFSDASYLVEAYSDTGTLLDLVNTGRAIDSCSGGTGAGLDEALAMFYTVELLRTVEALHDAGVIHGDIKADNMLVRCADSAPDGPFSAAGSHGWAAHGLTLIDLGRGIDVKCFAPHTRFVADWATSDADCAEMRDGRPWTYHIDYHGVAAVAHTLLFGKYLSVVPERDQGLAPGLGRRHRPRETLKRYWSDVWADLFSLALNPGPELPITAALGNIRARMEEWLVSPDGGERGEGLRAKLRRVEEATMRRRK